MVVVVKVVEMAVVVGVLAVVAAVTVGTVRSVVLANVLSALVVVEGMISVMVVAFFGSDSTVEIWLVREVAYWGGFGLG